MDERRGPLAAAAGAEGSRYSIAGSTPTVLKIRRVTELKKVCATSASARPARPLDVAGLHRGPAGALQDRVLQDVAHVGHRAVEMDAVEGEPLVASACAPRQSRRSNRSRARRVISSKPWIQRS